MSKLTWIDDMVLEDAVFRMLARAKRAEEKAGENMAKNVIDPFTSLVLAATSGMKSLHGLNVAQKMNSLSQGIASAVGAFHQEVLSSAPGFVNHDAGYDLECEEKRIIAEIKNKHNTMNASTQDKVVADLETALRQKSGQWTAYLVTIIPKSATSVNKKLLERREVYLIDGASFYQLATGSATALRDVYLTIEKIVSELAVPPADEILEYCLAKFDAGIPETNTAQAKRNIP